MNKFRSKLYTLPALIAVLLFSSCASAVTIREDLSPAEIIQRGQEALDRNRYNAAIQYYQALYDRNPHIIDLIITAEYHIANIHYKQKKYGQARAELNAILEYYNSPDEELLPQHYKKLAVIVLEKIDEKDKPRARASRRNNR